MSPRSPNAGLLGHKRHYFLLGLLAKSFNFKTRLTNREQGTL